jgi:REP element-mobilizing transposase RayT
MPRPRKAQISLADTPYYHITSRCVRRTFLCCIDHETGHCYEHRRKWIEQRMRLLASVFEVDILAYAVMSNHYHLVVKLHEPAELDALSDNEIIQRWCCLYQGPLLLQNYLHGNSLSPAEQETLSELIALWRERLCSISEFMQCLNQPIARQANQEDNCTGHFWESRFKSTPLLTEQALLSCMAYVDLNPIRAGLAQTPETSEYTSIQERITPQFDLAEAIKQQIPAPADNALVEFTQPLKPLLAFEGKVTQGMQPGLLFSHHDYLTLVDRTGRVIREDKRGFIPQELAPILERLTMDFTTWQQNTTAFEALYAQRFRPKRRKKAA